MDLSIDDVEINQAERDKASAERVTAEIAALKSKVTYSPALRFGVLGAIFGNYLGGVGGAIVGALGGGYLGNRTQLNDVDKAVIHNQIRAKEKELESIIQRGNLAEKEISGILSSQDLVNFQYDAYSFDGKWAEFMGSPAKGFALMVYGKPKQGKSIWSVQFAQYCTGFGKVLYNAAEEGFSVTLQNKIREFAMTNPNLYFSNFRTFEELKNALMENVYNFCFIDSVNFMKMTPEQIEEIKSENPYTAFITVLQATKDGQFRGSQEYAHNCDVIVQIEAGKAYQEGRFHEPSYMDVFPPKEGEKEEKPEVETMVDNSEEVVGKKRRVADPFSPKKKRGRPSKQDLQDKMDNDRAWGSYNSESDF